MMSFYDYLEFIQDVIKAKTHLDAGFYRAKMSLVTLHDHLNDELEAQA